MLRGCRTALIAFVAAATLAGCASSPPPPRNPAGVRIHTPARVDGFAGAVPARPYPLPVETFTDTAGRSASLAATVAAKPVTVVFFGYTYCPDVCNTVLADVAAALRRVDPASRDKVALAFITTDPARDSPAVIREYLDRFDSSFVGLRAALPAVERTARALGVALTGNKRLPGGGYEVGHGAQLIGFGVDHRGQVVWTPGTPVGDLRADLARLAAGSLPSRG
jgi:protein SCO1